MYVVVLLCAPGQGRLEPALAEGLRNAWGGGHVQWLCPNEAAEFEIPVIPSNHRDVWRDCQDMGVDLLVIPAENRRKSVLIADMDSTIIQQECIDELAAEVGFGEQVSEITALAMDGKIDFREALDARVKLLKGLRVSVIDQVLNTRIDLMPGAPTLLNTMRAHGAYAALVSGGFTHFTQSIAGTLGFDENRANRLVATGDTLTGEVEEPIVDATAKVAALREICEVRGVTPADAIAVGDGANDLGMLGLAGMGVALHAKPSVAAQCDLRVNFGDLTALLYAQGYARSEFQPG